MINFNSMASALRHLPLWDRLYFDSPCRLDRYDYETYVKRLDVHKQRVMDARFKTEATDSSFRRSLWEQPKGRQASKEFTESNSQFGNGASTETWRRRHSQVRSQIARDNLSVLEGIYRARPHVPTLEECLNSPSIIALDARRSSRVSIRPASARPSRPGSARSRRPQSARGPRPPETPEAMSRPPSARGVRVRPQSARLHGRPAENYAAPGPEMHIHAPPHHCARTAPMTYSPHHQHWEVDSRINMEPQVVVHKMKEPIKPRPPERPRCFSAAYQGTRSQFDTRAASKTSSSAETESTCVPPMGSPRIGTATWETSSSAADDD